MKYKYLILISFILILCGCTSEVNIHVTEDNISENISIDEYTTLDLEKEEIKESYRNYVPVYYDVEIYDEDPDEEVSGVAYYNHTINDLGNGYNNTYSYTYRFQDYKKASSIKYAFRSFSIIKDSKERTITLLTDSNGLLYFDQYPRLETIRVNITTDMEVLDTNGELNDGTYTWLFSKYDKEKSIYLEMKMHDEVVENTNDEESNSKEKKKVNLNLILILVFAFFIFLIIFIKIYKFDKDN